ncbi:MAG: transcriptional regulator, partial [candidate division Zixibacteria bacterium]|nr:transcriptional regulator [candidate division Zixibacteria bacterium]
LNAEKLAEECGVTERTIYRDIISLSEAHVPVYYDNGYKLASDNFLPALNFNLDEYACLNLVLESTPLAHADSYARILKQIRAKIETGLSDAIKREKRTLTPTTHVDIPTTLSEKRRREYFSAIEDAIDARRCLDMSYETINHGLTDRTVEPYFIVFRGHAFYFVGWCQLRDGFRTFRLDRIRLLSVADRTFVRRPGVSADDYFRDSWLLFSGPATDVVVRFVGAAARVVRSTKHHPNEEVRELADGSLEYRVSVRGIEEITRWIIGFGTEARVIRPASLISRLADLGAYLSNAYATD